MEPPQRREPATRTAPPASERPDPRNTGDNHTAPTKPDPNARHEAVQDTHIDWAKLGATVVEDDLIQPDEATPARRSAQENNRRVAPQNRPPDERAADANHGDVTGAPAPPAPRTSKDLTTRPEPTFKRHDSTIFDFDRLRENTRGPDEAKDQPNEEKE